jgi:YD repeat-containing protein
VVLNSLWPRNFWILVIRQPAAAYDNGQFFHYEYDAKGNRTAETTGAGRVSSV